MGNRVPRHQSRFKVWDMLCLFRFDTRFGDILGVTDFSQFFSGVYGIFGADVWHNTSTTDTSNAVLLQNCPPEKNSTHGRGCRRSNNRSCMDFTNLSLYLRGPDTSRGCRHPLQSSLYSLRSCRWGAGCLLIQVVIPRSALNSS